MTAPSRFEISAELYEAMIAHVRDALPYEGCGLIAVDGERAVKLYPGTNTERSATRYNMDVREVVAALREIEDRGWRLGAIFHSHPRSSARPSRVDLQHVYYPEALMVIISLAGHQPRVHAYRVTPGGPYSEVPVRVVRTHKETGD